jgi:hypothetical protein
MDFKKDIRINIVFLINILQKYNLTFEFLFKINITTKIQPFILSQNFNCSNYEFFLLIALNKAISHIIY